MNDMGPDAPSANRRTSGRRAASRRKPRTATSFVIGVMVGLSVVLLDNQLFGPPLPAPGPGKGQNRSGATSPAALPPKTWKTVLGRAWSEFNSDHIPAVAGGATFFGLLALFPALGVFVSLYGLVADVDQARQQVMHLRGVLPKGAISVLSEQMARLASTPHSRLGIAFATSLTVSLWGSNAGDQSVHRRPQRLDEETEKRNFMRLNLVSLAFTVGAIVLGFAGAALPGVVAAAGLQGSAIIGILQWPALLFLLCALLSILYRYGPSRAHARWRWITPGSAFAAVAWLAMSLLFSVYVANFGHYDKTYGSLGAIVGFMTWIWLSLTVVLLGAELNSELEKQTSTDTTTGPAQPRGQRGAAVAD